MGIIKSGAKAIDDRLFNDSFRRALVNGKLLRNHKRCGLLGDSLEALKRERTVPDEHYLFRPEHGRFIGGVSGRSGTTWLTRLIAYLTNDTHAVIGEQGLFVLGMFREAPYEYLQFGGEHAGRRTYLDYFEKVVTTWAYKRRKIYGQGLKGPMRYIPVRAIRGAMRHLREEVALCTDLLCVQRAFGDFYQALLNYHAATLFGNRADWISKEPPYGRHADTLFRFVPTAQLVVLSRDGREASLSMYKRGWGDSIRSCMKRWGDFTQMTLDSLAGAPEEKWMLLRYDDLVADFEPQIRQVFAHLRLPEPDVERVSGSGNKDLLPRTASIGRWKNEITTADIDWFNSQYGATMEALGYHN